MRRDDARLVADVEPVESARRMLHRLPIRLASHDDAYHPPGAAHWISSRNGCEDWAILEARLVRTSSPEIGCTACRSGRSGNDIGQQLALDFRDLVLKQQLSFLQAL